MILEAVWLKNGREVLWVDPVLNITCDDDIKNISDIEVFNGYGWYSSNDCEDSPNDFIIRIRKEKEYSRVPDNYNFEVGV